MSPFPDDDPQLTNFLRRHQPQPPPADPYLEDQILHTIEQGKSGRAARSPRRPRYWLPATIAASLVAGVLTYRNLSPTPTPDLSGLESFIETTWNGTFVSDDANDLAPLIEVSNEGGEGERLKAEG